MLLLYPHYECTYRDTMDHTTSVCPGGGGGGGGGGSNPYDGQFTMLRGLDPHFRAWLDPLDPHF